LSDSGHRCARRHDGSVHRAGASAARIATPRACTGCAGGRDSRRRTANGDQTVTTSGASWLRPTAITGPPYPAGRGEVQFLDAVDGSPAIRELDGVKRGTQMNP